MKRRDAMTRGCALAMTAIAGCSSGDGRSEPATEPPDGPVVDVGPERRFTFVPGTEQALEVTTGTTVTWIWRSDTHNVVVDRQPDGADWEGHETIEDTGFSYQHTFEVPGEYHYVCIPHRSSGMVGDVVVE